MFHCHMFPIYINLKHFIVIYINLKHFIVKMLNNLPLLTLSDALAATIKSVNMHHVSFDHHTIIKSYWNRSSFILFSKVIINVKILVLCWLMMRVHCTIHCGMHHPLVKDQTFFHTLFTYFIIIPSNVRGIFCWKTLKILLSIIFCYLILIFFKFE